MAKLIAMFLLLTPGLSLGQPELGKYRLCFNMHWKCHTQLELELLEGNVYRFVYSDDTQTASSTGSYELRPDKLVLTPNVIPDTIKISFNERDITKTVRDRLAGEGGIRVGRKHVVSATKDFEPLENHDIEIFSGHNFIARTNSHGNTAFKGPTPDSIKLNIQDRAFTFYPKHATNKNLYNIWITTDFKDIALAVTHNGEIQIVMGQMYLHEWNEQDQKNDKVYFRKLQ